MAINQIQPEDSAHPMTHWKSAINQIQPENHAIQPTENQLFSAG